MIWDTEILNFDLSEAAAAAATVFSERATHWPGNGGEHENEGGRAENEVPESMDEDDENAPLVCDWKRSYSR